MKIKMQDVVVKSGVVPELSGLGKDGAQDDLQKVCAQAYSDDGQRVAAKAFDLVMEMASPMVVLADTLRASQRALEEVSGDLRRAERRVDELEKSCDEWGEAEKRWQKERQDLTEMVAQLQVHLAGCGVAACGGTKRPAKRGDYGWSQPYQDVLDLRKKLDRLEGKKLPGRPPKAGATAAPEAPEVKSELSKSVARRVKVQKGGKVDEAQPEMHAGKDPFVEQKKRCDGVKPLRVAVKEPEAAKEPEAEG